jgi:peptidylprolyl isomerase
MSTSSTLLSTFRSATNASLRLRAPLNKRFFSPSASNMVIKTYFDCSWTGPEVSVDQSGNVTNVGSVKGTPAPRQLPCPHPIADPHRRADRPHQL